VLQAKLGIPTLPRGYGSEVNGMGQDFEFRGRRSQRKRGGALQIWSYSAPLEMKAAEKL
jgi:hypothetical protein